jgi:hypothetical protein
MYALGGLKSPKLGGSPLLQQGELDFSPAEKRFIPKGWALALDFPRPALKRMVKVELLSAMIRTNQAAEN